MKFFGWEALAGTIDESRRHQPRTAAQAKALRRIEMVPTFFGK
jgi:hypothetical protein